MTSQRVDPPVQADEFTLLQAFLQFHRDTLRVKVTGLATEQLHQTHPPSTLTLAQLLKHVALNEHHWFGHVLHDLAMLEPFASADWEADADWEMTSAAHDSTDELLRLMDDAVARADDLIREAYDLNGLDTLSARPDRQTQQPFSLRWIMLHMIEEYARHNGHADLIRESIDGATGE